LGQTSTQRLHMQHLRRSISHSLVGSLLTARAWVGHRFEQIPQNMQVLISIPMLPLVIGVKSLFRLGYMSVAGPAIRFFVTVLVIVNSLMISALYLSVQLIHGSRVTMILGMSASSEPFMILIMAGMLLKVGTRTRNLCRNFEPFPFT